MGKYQVIVGSASKAEDSQELDQEVDIQVISLLSSLRGLSQT